MLEFLGYLVLCIIVWIGLFLVATLIKLLHILEIFDKPKPVSKVVVRKKGDKTFIRWYW